ncbi:MAG TPA: hydroxyacylglutathione hydrolase [Burkholderiaceae bacterium]|nr:hydroxyacylglutathione hydrolase [Burkholderiaceae bacterium]
MFNVVALPAFTDNYLWLLHAHSHAIVVDPGDARVVQMALDTYGLALDAILLTHHHPDHTGGVAELVAHHGCRVIGPRRELIAHINEYVAEGDSVEVLDVRFTVLEVPGHTQGHIAYWCEAAARLFCGDTLFGAGCGRLLGGTPDQMWKSLRRLSALPDETQVYCAHEYTLANLRFARVVEPDNLAIANREQHDALQRKNRLPTIPTTIGLERQTNPFIRANEPSVMQRSASMASVESIARELAAWSPISPEARSFAVLRAWKNVFR